VVSVQYATGDQGAASLTLRVPSTRAADAVTRLSGLGTIVAQNVQIDDLQESLDTLDGQLERLRAQIAALTAAIDRAETSAERARLLERRAQAQAQLRDLRANRAATAEAARNATIQLDLRTEASSGVAAPGSRLDRALDEALAILAWEAVVVLALAVVLAPIALVALAVWGARRAHRRREEDRLLAAS
jgi:TolA-binding protein